MNDGLPRMVSPGGYTGQATARMLIRRNEVAAGGSPDPTLWLDKKTGRDVHPASSEAMIILGPGSRDLS